MPDTPLGITYPDASAHTRIWEHIQEAAEDVDDLITADRLHLSKLPLHVQAEAFTSAAFNGASGSVSSGSRNFPVTFGTAPQAVLLDPSPITGNTPFLWAITSISATGFNYLLKMQGTGVYSGTVTIRYAAIKVA